MLAPEHPLVSEITSPEQEAAVTAYVKEAINKSDLQRTDLATEKTGVFTGAFAINPANDEPIPIWVADYVLITYGTGAIMEVPGHDARDHEFAATFGMPIVEVISGGDKPIAEEPFVGDGVCVNSGFLNGLRVADAKEKMVAWLESEKKGTRQVQYRLRDWLFSRQRYWENRFLWRTLKMARKTEASSALR